jgi:hypothetical protein
MIVYGSAYLLQHQRLDAVVSRQMENEPGVGYLFLEWLNYILS